MIKKKGYMKLKAAGIRRKETYSPNHILNDQLILNKTAWELNKLDVEYKIYDEADISTEKIAEQIIFTMARGYDSLSSLSEMEKSGRLIINSPESSLNCYRVNMAAKLKEAGIPFPESKVVDTNQNVNFKISDTGQRKIWVKRGDVHAVHREDVSLVYSDEELNFLLKEFARRGISKAILQQHIYGDVIKFYSVRDTGFFRCYYVNGNNTQKPDEDRLRKLAVKSAKVMDLVVYGGDAIESENRSLTVIDINDWPSFAPFRDEAAKYIAAKIHSLAVEFCEKEEVSRQ